MKVTQIFGLVLLFHLVAISLILLQPGCQTRQPPPPPEGLPQSAPSPVERSAASTPAASRGDFVPESARRQPSRPPAGQGQESPRGGLDPAFNAGLTGGSGGVLQPIVEPTDSVAPAGGGQSTVYSVVAGDSLSRIAREYGVTINAIKNANNLTSNTIRVGQELVIPAPSVPTQHAAIDTAGTEVYTVSPGDTLSGIASRHGVTVTDLKANNGLTSDTIRVGQELFIPGGARSGRSASGGDSGGSDRRPASAATQGSGQTYTVQPGDTPSGIARRYGVDYRELMRLNNIASASRMRVGQELIIPAGGRQSQPQGATTSAGRPSDATGTRNTARTGAGSSPQPATLTPQTSQPARIGQGTTVDPLDAFDEFDLLESSEIPLMDVEVVDDPERNPN